MESRIFDRMGWVLLLCLFSGAPGSRAFCQAGDCRAAGVLSFRVDSEGAAGPEFRIGKGEELEFSISSMLETHYSGRWGVQGFSISVAHDPGVLEIISATEAGTDTAEVFPFAFERTELVDRPAGSGFVCAVVLSLSNPVTLPPEGVFSLARATYRVRPQAVNAGEDSPGETRVVSTVLQYRDGLRGSGQPVNNRLTHNGITIVPCLDSLQLSLLFLSGDEFIRGDSDSSVGLDISDSLRTIGYLFLGMEPPACLDAADINDDGRVDLADPVFCLDFLFRGGRPPPEPFPGPGLDPTEDALDCSSPGAWQ